MSRTRGLAALLAASALAGCTHPSPEREPASPAEPKATSGNVTVLGGGGVDAEYVAGNALYGFSDDGRPRTLASAMNPLLIAMLSPGAVPDPGGDGVVAYNSWRGTSPVLRIHDVATGEDTLLDRGAYSLAWRRDGALAYFKGLKAEVSARNIKGYLGHVVVRDSREARPVRWTVDPGVYVVAAWAGDRLLVYRIGEKWPDLLALDGPGRVRVLAKAGALIGVSPDGSRAFVSRYGASPPVVRVLTVDDGAEAARFTFPAGAAQKVEWLTESGSWVGDNVFAGSSVGLVVFRVAEDEIELEQTLRFDLGAFPLSVFEPQSDESARVVTTWGQLAELPRQPVPEAAVLECDRISLRCKQGPPVSSAVGLRLVYNPSRP